MPARAPSIACVVTPHGFGHAARACAVLEAVRRRAPGARFHVFTTVPRWFFLASLGGGFSWRRCDTDVGLVQRGPLEEDLPGTVARLRGFYPLRPAAVDGLARRIRALGCAAVLCDIAPLGIAAARAAGLPSVLVENFTWDWIYRGYARREPRLRPFADGLRRLFAAATVRVEAEPVCVPAPGAVRAGPVARRPRAPRAKTRTALGVPPRRPLVLVTMGGVRHGGFALEPLLAAEGASFVLAGGARRRRRVGNCLLLPHRSGLYHPDLVAAADAVVGKMGYSTLAEACRAGVPYGFVPRPAFRESAVLERWLLARGQGLAIGEEELASGAWARRLPELLGLGRRAPCPDGAGEAARALLEAAEGA